MGKYVVRRILIALVVLVVISMLNFGFINLAPGDPLQALLPPEALRTGVGRLYEDAGLAVVIDGDSKGRVAGKQDGGRRVRDILD